MLLLLALACVSSDPKNAPCILGCDTGESPVGPDSADTGDSPTDSDTDSAPDSDTDTDSDTDPDSAPPDDSAVDTGDPVDTADTAEEEEEEDEAAWLFDDDTIHVIDITLGAASSSALGSDPYTYVQGDITIDGIEVPTVGLRLKGKYGSYRTLAQKAAFKIDFNLYVEGQEFYGLKKLNLNNMAVDCSMVKEHTAYRVYRDMGLAAERTGYAWVTVDGHDYGLYNILEQPNKEMLKRFYDHASGNLYDGKYYLYPDWSYVLLDFTPSAYTFYELEEGDDVALADVENIVSLVAEWQGRDGFYDALGEYVDWDTLLLYWATEQWVGQIDGYVTNRNNNFIYFDAEDGKMEMIPWDLDYSFLEDSAWGMSWKSPAGVLAQACQADATCMDEWKDAVRKVVARADADAYADAIDHWADLIEDAAADDPRKECSDTALAATQRAVKTWVKNRSDGMSTYWSL